MISTATMRQLNFCRGDRKAVSSSAAPYVVASRLSVARMMAAGGC